MLNDQNGKTTLDSRNMGKIVSPYASSDLYERFVSIAVRGAAAPKGCGSVYWGQSHGQRVGSGPISRGDWLPKMNCF